MSAWSDYVEWSGLDEAMLAHPAGKGVPESCEVVQARMDAEACELGSSNYRRIDQWHHSVSARQCPLWVRVAGQVVAIVSLFLIVVAASVLGEMHGGWPA